MVSTEPAANTYLNAAPWRLPAAAGWLVVSEKTGEGLELPELCGVAEENDVREDQRVLLGLRVVGAVHN